MRLKKFVTEFIIVLLAGLTSGFFNESQTHIEADGVGYYDYLPSVFIHADLFRGADTNPDTSRIHQLNTYSPYGNGKVNKYHCGTAVLLSPFFFVAQVFAADHSTGYEPVFQWSVLVAALFYVWLTLVLLRKTLELYGIKRWIIISVQLALLFGTNVLYYTIAESAFSHVYSLFAVTAFLFCAKKYFGTQEKKYILWMSVLIGLIFIIRPVNILIILFLPFIAGSMKPVTELIIRVIRDVRLLMMSVLLCFAVISIQLFAWYAQTGDFLVYSYGNEGFEFLHPHFTEILFSFRKGLFIYTPVLLFAFLGPFWINGNRLFVALSFIIPFTMLTYILSSWHDWLYGYSFGLRAYIEFFPLFFILIATGLNQISGFKNLVWVPITMCVALNLFQTGQFTVYTLHGYTMDFQKYCKVFLRSSQPYQEILLKDDFNEWEFSLDTSFSKTVLVVPAGHCDTLLLFTPGELSGEHTLSKIRLTAENDFSDDDSTLFDLSVFRNETELIYYRAPYLIHLANGPLNEKQTGIYWFNVSHLSFNPGDKILIRVFTASKPCELTQLKIDFFSAQSD